MNQPARAQEPSMEEILASIRRIIADDDSSKGPTKAESPKAENPMPPPPTPMAPKPAPAPRPVEAVAPPPPPPVEPVMQQDDLDSMLGDLDKVPEKPDADVLDLTEAMAAEIPSPEPAAMDFPPMPDLHSEPVPPARPLISSSTSAAVDSAFNTLAHTVLVQNARTLEDLVREMLRPLLKTWLDDNLPGMVERLVRAEIERVSRGRN
jgi:cell pole-organizing protein PopZ